MADIENNPVGVVVGGANGIGESCARLMHARGWKVVIVDRDAEAAEALASEISGEAIILDVTDAVAVEQAASDFESRFGSMQGLVVSSGVFQEHVPVEDTDLTNLDRILSVNFAGTYLAVRFFGRVMARSGSGSIVTLASAVAHMSTPSNIYSPTKAAILNMTKSFAGEWGRSGVRVNSVSPGITLVPRVRERLGSGSRYPKNIEEMMALGRCVEPDEVAETVEFLLSSRASGITGSDIIVDCGWIAAALWPSYGGLRDPEEA